MTKKKKNNSKLDQIEKKNIFSVPEHYFSSAEAFQPEGKLYAIKEELHKNIYAIPEGYFEKLPSSIASKISRKQILAKSQLKQNVFSIPPLYFETLAEHVLNKITDERAIQAKELNRSIYNVPEEYFDSLPDKIQARVTKQKRFKLPQYDAVSTSKPVLSYSMAAAFALIMMVVGVRYFFVEEKTETAKVQNIPKAVIQAEKMIASLSKAEIHEYLTFHENVETADIVEVSSQKKKDKIEKHFEQYILPKTLKKKDRQDLEIEMEDIDIEDLEI